MVAVLPFLKKGLIIINNKIKKTAERLSKAIRGNIDFENLCKYIKQYGYDVVFFRDCDDPVIKRYGLSEEMQNRIAITYSSSVSIIFIKYSENPDTYAATLLHEIGHVVLGHINAEYIELHNNYQLDADVNQFIQAVYHYSSAIEERKTALRYIAIVGTILIVMIGVIYSIHRENQLTIRELTQEVMSLNDDYVYITSTGKKYHRPSCIYAKSGVKVLKSEIESMYDPCKVCNP